MNTLRLVFGHVYLFRIPMSNDNIVLVSDRSIDFGLLERAVGTELQGIAQLSRPMFRESKTNGKYQPLTDDRAPIEHMVDWEILKQSIKVNRGGPGAG
jgi:hypothetical protein